MDAGAARAVIHAHGLLAILRASIAHGALLHQVQALGALLFVDHDLAFKGSLVLGDEGTRVVRAGLHAQTAADALLVIHDDRTFFCLGRRLHRTNLHARSVVTMHTHGQLITLMGLRVLAPLNALDAVVINAGTGAVAHLTCDDAGIAAQATGQVKYHSILCHFQFLHFAPVYAHRPLHWYRRSQALIQRFLRKL